MTIDNLFVGLRPEAPNRQLRDLQGGSLCRTFGDCSVGLGARRRSLIGVNIWGIIHGIRYFVPAILRQGKKGMLSTPPQSPAFGIAAALTRGRIR